ncbi:hypothetical protein GUB63_25975, partial [Escherichia coli]|nr:hypothetical protein [Escherichia coli]
MSQPVGDLVIDLSLDAVRFDEQMSRVRRHFSGLDTDARKTASAVEQGLSRQALAAQKAGISVGQYKAAMRTLPAQFTDIATQLAGGQNPWLILLQQGGQVKDSFGGMIPMFRGLAGAITLPMVGVTSLAVATGALVYAWYQGDSTLSAFNKTLVLSGNQSGLTADRMLTLSRAGQAAGLTFNQARESLAALVNAGVRGGEQFDAINQSVARFASASGVEVDKVAEAFGKLTTDPTSGLTAMARQFRNVTAEQIAYVAQLQRSGDEAGALQAANDIATKGFDEQTRRLKENMGTLETWADKTGKAFKSMWDAILDIGRPESSADMLASAQKAFDEADKKWQWYQSRSQRRGKTASFRANLQGAGLTFNQARESLAALVNAGVRGGEQFDAINQSVARFASASGVEVDKVAEAFGKLTTDPTSGLMAMARQFRNVTAEQIAYVAQLQRSGDEAGALQAANDIATKGFDEQTRRLKENMGTLETWADKTGKAFKSMWDAILDIGRP